jgi:hypothetical protein
MDKHINYKQDELMNTYREMADENFGQAEIHHQQGNTEQATIHYQRAKLLYETIGDNEKVGLALALLEY